jgi:hypothetical protein
MFNEKSTTINCAFFGYRCMNLLYVIVGADIIRPLPLDAMVLYYVLISSSRLRKLAITNQINNPKNVLPDIPSHR